MNFRNILTAGGLAVLTLGAGAEAQVIGGDLNIDGSRNDVDFFGGEMRVTGEVDGDIFAIAGDGEIDAIVDGDIEIFGGDFEIRGQVRGSIDIAGGDLTIEATVDESLNAAGGSLSISGSVGDEINAAGGSVEVSSQIGDDANLAGGYVRLTSQSSVAGSSEIVGGEIHLDGRMEGRVSVEGEEVVLSGRFLDEVEVLAEDVRITAGAEFSAPLVVRGPNEPVVETGANIANLDYREEWFNFGARNWDDIDIHIDGPWKVIGAPFEFLGGAFVGSAFILGLIAVLLAPSGVSTVARTFRNRPVSSGLIGFITFAMSPVIMVMLTVLLAITVIGVFLIPLIWMLYPVVLFLAFAFGGVAVGDLIFNRNRPNEGLGLAMRAASLLIVLVAVVVLGAVPGLGATSGLIVMCIGLGAWILSFGNKTEHRESDNSEPPRRDPEPEIDADAEPA